MGMALTDTERRPCGGGPSRISTSCWTALAAQGTRDGLLLGRDGLAVGVEHAQAAQALLDGQVDLVIGQSQQPFRRQG